MCSFIYYSNNNNYLYYINNYEYNILYKNELT